MSDLIRGDKMTVQLQQATCFSQSRLWQLQRDYFADKGIDAWRSGEVPHYISSNPVMGKTYAELVLAFLRDLALKGQTTQTVYLLELGAGHGRLCYHFFKHFEKYYQQSALTLPPFCYVLSDFTPSNVDYWQTHPRLQPYLAQGWLDFAVFDVLDSSEIELRQRAITLGAGCLNQPLMVIANYFFDSIPQALFQLENGQMSQCLLALLGDSESAQMSTVELIETIELQYSYQLLQENTDFYANEPVLNELLSIYRDNLKQTHLLLPHQGIRVLQRLKKWSDQGLLLLTADKGEHHLTHLDYRGAPKLDTHGSFSLSVNYHAFKHYCTTQGGSALFSRHQPGSLNVGCLLLLPEPSTYVETCQAYERFVNDFGPDDYFSLKKLIEKQLDNLSCIEIMSIIRLSGYDARLFIQMLPRVFDCVPALSENQRWDLFLAIPRLWDTHYPLGESEDLAFDLGNLLYVLGFYPEALVYYDLSIQIYGQSKEVLSNIALCYKTKCHQTKCYKTKCHQTKCHQTKPAADYTIAGGIDNDTFSQSPAW